jgi:hypothetical protein
MNLAKQIKEIKAAAKAVEDLHGRVGDLKRAIASRKAQGGTDPELHRQLAETNEAIPGATAALQRTVADVAAELNNFTPGLVDQATGVVGRAIGPFFDEPVLGAIVNQSVLVRRAIAASADRVALFGVPLLASDAPRVLRVAEDCETLVADLARLNATIPALVGATGPGRPG